MKKAISILLSLVMLFSVTAGMNITAKAIGQYGVDLNSAGYNSQNIYKNRPQCTWYCWGRAYEKLGVSLPKWSNAISWDDYADADPNYSVGTVARANSIMVENDTSGDGHGHVMFVEKVENGYAYITEGNWLSSDYHEDRINLSTMVRDSWTSHTLSPVRYIYLDKTYNQKPSNVKIALEKTSFYSSEHITYYCSGNDVSYYVISIYNSTGSILETVRINPGEYCIRYYNPGTYSVYCEAFNNCGSTFSNTIKFNVKTPTNPYDVKLSLEKTNFFTDEHITYYCTGKEVSYYVLSIYNSSGTIVETVRINPGDYCIRYYDVGTYTAYCEAFNSCGKTFSNNVSFAVKQKCKVHTWSSGVTTEKSTCTATGTKLYTCTVCGETKTETIKAKGHTTVIDKAVPSTCTTDGKTEGSHCSVCNAVIKKQNVVKATGHKPVTVKGTPATFKAAGKTDGKKCSVCGKVLTAQKTIAKLGSPSLSKVTAGKKQFKATWKSVSSIDGYQIQYSTSSTFKSGNKTVTVSGYKSTSKPVTKLTAKKKYYVHIRAYKTINGKKQYSAWSKSKTVTTKK